jgi:hypothetical protein
MQDYKSIQFQANMVFGGTEGEVPISLPVVVSMGADSTTSYFSQAQTKMVMSELIVSLYSVPVGLMPYVHQLSTQSIKLMCGREELKCEVKGVEVQIPYNHWSAGVVQTASPNVCITMGSWMRYDQWMQIIDELKSNPLV